MIQTSEVFLAPTPKLRRSVFAFVCVRAYSFLYLYYNFIEFLVFIILL